MKRCPSCRTEYAGDDQFCTNDGTRLMPGSDSAANIRATTATHRPAGDDGPTGTAMAGRLLDIRYEVEEQVGEGGTSFVYLATDVSTQRRCAIKVLPATLSRDANAMARLKWEAGLGNRLAHPNVCRIVSVGETEDGLLYVVMPFMEGETLWDRNTRLGHIPLDETVRFVQDVAAGLHAAHALNIVHGDLKPENVMVCQRPDGTEYAVVMDFGLAREHRIGAELQDSRATRTILGTPEFMSPEQLRGRPLDARTDIYSLSLLTYEMLTGRLPFQGRTQQESLIARLHSDPVPLRKMRPDLNFPEAVERVLNKAMARNPDDRPQTTLEFGGALAAAAALAASVCGDNGQMAQPFAR